jgi:hypothetical protein
VNGNSTNQASGARLLIGLLAICAAPILLLVGYGTRPSAAACQTINSIQPGTCSTSPPTGYIVAAIAFLIIGLLLTAPWWGRWIGGKNPW